MGVRIEDLPPRKALADSLSSSCMKEGARARGEAEAGGRTGVGVLPGEESAGGWSPDGGHRSKGSLCLLRSMADGPLSFGTCAHRRTELRQRIHLKRRNRGRRGRVNLELLDTQILYTVLFYAL